jgi:hypothetical protein
MVALTSLQYCNIDYYIIEQVAWNKSSLLLNIIIQNTQTLQLFTVIIKTEIIYKSYKKARLDGLGDRT